MIESFNIQNKSAVLWHDEQRIQHQILPPWWPFAMVIVCKSDCLLWWPFATMTICHDSHLPQWLLAMRTICCGYCLPWSPFVLYQEHAVSLIRLQNLFLNLKKRRRKDDKLFFCSISTEARLDINFINVILHVKMSLPAICSLTNPSESLAVQHEGRTRF